MATITTDAEPNVIKKADLDKATEIVAIERFTGSLQAILEVLGVARRVPVAEGSDVNVYNTTGTLQDGNVPEGDVIPLSKVEIKKVSSTPINFLKYRKAVTGEAIQRSGRDVAITQTSDWIVRQIQKNIRTNFLNVVKTGTGGTVTAEGLQPVMAGLRAKVNAAFEDDAPSTVAFMNNDTVSQYLAKSEITMQTTFGMNYLVNFMGFGTVIVTEQVANNEVWATAYENLVMYYITAGSNEIASEFNLTTDPSGYLGLATYVNPKRFQSEMIAISGIMFMPERIDGIFKGEITGGTPGYTFAAASAGTGDAVGTEG